MMLGGKTMSRNKRNMSIVLLVAMAISLIFTGVVYAEEAPEMKSIEQLRASMTPAWVKLVAKEYGVPKSKFYN